MFRCAERMYRATQDILNLEWRPGCQIPNSSLRYQKSGQRTTPWHSPSPMSQGLVHASPGFTCSTNDSTGNLSRPITGPLMVFIHPTKYLAFCEFRKIQMIADTTFAFQELGQ